MRAPGGGVSEGVIGWTLPYVTAVLIWGGNQDTDLYRGLTMSGNRYNGISYAGREAAEDAALPALAFGLAAPRAVPTAADEKAPGSAPHYGSTRNHAVHEVWE